jgi:hypothetical protein
MEPRPAVIPGPGPNTDHGRHHVHPHDHQWMRSGYGDRPVFKPCTGKWWCEDCRTWFSGSCCRVAGHDQRLKPGDGAMFIGRIQ